MRTMRVLMLIMTVLSFITSIFGVFAVVYVAVYVRRLEIGMLKAIGMRRRDLVGAFALEAVMMTVSASLAGVTAGTVLGYVFYASNNMMRNTPTQLTFDWITTAAILVMVVLASVISAVLAARGVAQSKVTEVSYGKPGRVVQDWQLCQAGACVRNCARLEPGAPKVSHTLREG